MKRDDILAVARGLALLVTGVFVLTLVVSIPVFAAGKVISWLFGLQW
jgi:hypothetical protein